MFCEKCKSMIFPKDGKYVCKKCGYEGEIKKKSDKPKDPALDNGKIYTEEGKVAVDDDMVVIGTTGKDTSYIHGIRIHTPVEVEEGEDFGSGTEDGPGEEEGSGGE